MGFLAHLGFHETHRRPLRLELGGDLVSTFRVSVRKRDAGALLDETPHRRFTDAGGSAGDRDYLAFEPTHRLVSLR